MKLEESKFLTIKEAAVLCASPKDRSCVSAPAVACRR